MYICTPIHYTLESYRIINIIKYVNYYRHAIDLLFVIV